MRFLSLIDVDDREVRVRKVRRHGVDRSRLGEADADRQVIAVTRERRQIRDVVLRRLRLEDALLDSQLRLGTLQPQEREMVEAAVVEPADVGDEPDLELAATRRRGRGIRRGLLPIAATAGSDEEQEGANECERSFHSCPFR